MLSLVCTPHHISNVMSGQSSKDDIFIFIMRHGEAESLLTDDKSRNLTLHGKSEVRVSSNWLTESYCQDGELSLALVSPYTRTRQTFNALSETLHAAQSEICDDIVPEGNVRLAHDYIDVLAHQMAKSRKGKPLLIVSHMPFVSFLLDALCDSHQMTLFATGSVAVVKYNLTRGKGVLVKHFQGNM